MIKRECGGTAPLVITALIVVALVGYGLSGKLLGQKPTKHFAPPSEFVSFEEPLQEARSLVEKEPKNLDARRGLASLLFSRLTTVQREKDAERFDVLELLDTLSLILKEEPADLGAILMMADLSFREQVYDKAAQFYEKYLTREPKDHHVRAKYGGALAYIGKHQKAVKELEAVVKQDPQYFPAKVYLGVAKVGLGKKTEAIKLLTEAAEQIGPDSAAGVEIVRLIAKVQGKPVEKVERLEEPASYKTLGELLKANPILGPKLVSVVEKQDVVELTVHDFPVTQMPEFARQKLLSRIFEFGRGQGKQINLVRFIDADSKSLIGEYKAG